MGLDLGYTNGGRLTSVTLHATESANEVTSARAGHVSVGSPHAFVNIEATVRDETDKYSWHEPMHSTTVSIFISPAAARQVRDQLNAMDLEDYDDGDD